MSVKRDLRERKREREKTKLVLKNTKEVYSVKREREREKGGIKETSFEK